MMTAPYDLMIDSGGDQFPVASETPRLAWKSVAGDGRRAHEIEATIDGVVMVRVVLDGDADRLWASWPWRPLRSREKVEWRVRNTAGDWSATHRFEAGIFDGDWRAGWISPVESTDEAAQGRPAHVLSVEFAQSSPVVAARLYATALGLYEAFVNGDRAGSAQLSPGASSYEKTLYAQAFDVTETVRIGANRLEIVLSDGWYRGHVGAFRVPAIWGSTVAARAELHLELADGTTSVIHTGGDWMSARSTIERADLMGGQTTDYLAAARPVLPVIVDAVSAPPIRWSPAPPVRVVATRPPLATRSVRDGVWVVDFGQNASGWVRLSDLGPVGTRTTLEYGEHQDASGDLSTGHLDSSRPGEARVRFSQRDVVVSDGGGEVFEPRHTVHGFQFVRVTREGAGFDPKAIEMQVVHTDFRRVGAFECSAPELNRLHEIADWSFRGNAVDIPTDCPTRERLGWTGDYQIFAPTATRLYDVSGFTRKWLQSVRDDQLDDGRIANFSPDGRRIKINLDSQFATMTGSAGWGDAIVAVPWEMFTAYGDPAFLSENWDSMVRWVEWALATARTERHPSRVERSVEPMAHEAYIWDGSFHWGEWIEPKNRRPDGTLIDPIQDDPATWFMADKGEVGTAFLYRSVHTLSLVADVLGRAEDAVALSELAIRIHDAWRAEFLADTGRTSTDTQAAYVRALSFGLIPDHLTDAAATRLVELIHEASGHLATGFLSTGDLLPVLADHGHAAVAYEVLLQRSSPSWLNMIDRGATTIWEDWDGIDERGDAHESLNHYSKGAAIRFLHTHVLGLRQAPDSRGWKSVTIQPLPTSSITWARGSHESPRGEIAVSWHTVGDELALEVQLPAGTNGTLVMPDGSERQIGAGLTTATAAIRANGEHLRA